MGEADQLIKRRFSEEAPLVTNHRVSFEVAAEIPTGSLTPDGMLRLAKPTSSMSDLPSPWDRVVDEVMLDFKMWGDHTDRAALARLELRRMALMVHRLENMTATDETPAPVPDPRRLSAWIVAPHQPQWIAADAAQGILEIDLIAPGCLRIGPRGHELLWVSANDLPLHPALIPLLLVRSGRALVEFMLWALAQRGDPWVLGVLQEMPMGQHILEELDIPPTDPAEQRRIKIEFAKKFARNFPEAIAELQQEGIEKGIEKGTAPLMRLIERRLKRVLTAVEHTRVLARLDSLGPERLGDVALDLSQDELSAWLADPNAH